MLRRHVLLGGAALAVSPLASAVAAAPPRLVLHEWFQGRTHAVGAFLNRFTGEERRLAVDLIGRWNGRRLTLFEDFFYADGERDQKTWVFERTGPETYRGTREDVVVPAEVTSPAPDTVVFGYTADLQLPSGITRLGFQDKLVLRPDGTVLNTATVSRFFIPVGDVTLVFRRGRLPARLKRSGGA